MAESQFYNLVFSFSFVLVSLLRAYRFFYAGCLSLLVDSLSWKTMSFSYTMKQELERPRGDLEGTTLAFTFNRSIYVENKMKGKSRSNKKLPEVFQA